MLESLVKKTTAYRTRSGSVYTCKETYEGELLTDISWRKSPNDSRLARAVYFQISPDFARRLRTAMQQRTEKEKLAREAIAEEYNGENGALLIMLNSHAVAVSADIIGIDRT